MSGLPVPVMATRATSDIMTAAIWNAQVRDLGNFVLGVPQFEGYQTTAQTIPATTNTAVALDTNSIDTYSGHSTTVNNTQYFAQIAGYYTVRGLVTFSSNPNGQRFASIAANGTTIARTTTSCSAVNGFATGLATGTATVFLNVGDYLQLQATQLAGGPLALAAFSSVLNLEWVHS